MPADPASWSRRRFLGTGGALTAGLALGACSLDRASSPDNSQEEPEAGGWSGTLIDPPFEKPDVTLTDLDGQPFPILEKTQGQLTLLFFGYTSCPDICPVYLNTVYGAKEAIGTGPGSKPLVLFVGVDVARDTPEVLRTYLGNIDESFVGLTGTEEAIEGAIKAVKGAPTQLEEPDENGDYLVGHYSRITVFSPDDRIHRLYPPDVRQQQWVKDLPRLAQGEFK